MVNILFKRKLLIIALLGQIVFAAPVTISEVSNAAAAFVSVRYAESNSQNIPVSNFNVSKITPLNNDLNTVGYIVSLNPTGFVLVRADSELPFKKLYSDSCNFSDLPPDFVKVMKWELETELSILADKKSKDKNYTTVFKKEWENLLTTSSENNGIAALIEQDAYPQLGPLMTTFWEQDEPYNYYAPVASGGPGGRALVGCVACAMAQVMKYHDYPTTGRGSHTYTDNYGDCTGTHSVDFSATTYNWANMPNTINNSSSETQKQAVGKIMYHCGVAVNMNYEADGSGAYSESVPDALRNYFKYDCLDLTSRPDSSRNAEWYYRVQNDISKNRPIYYSFSYYSNGAGGHAVVVDGCRNGNEFHVNFGWGNSYPPSTAWYNMDDINGFNYNHDAVFGICEEGTLDDNYEPNESKNLAFDLSHHYGQWLSSISNKGVQVNEDWYKFTIDVAPDMIVITCAFVNADGDLLLELYDDNDKIAESQTENDGEVIEYYASAPGTYYVKVDSANGPAYPWQKEYWLNDYDLMVAAPEGVGIFNLLTLIIITLRRKL